MEDIEYQINECIKEGCQLVIMVNINEYIYIQRLKTFFYKMGLRELIIDKHRPGGLATNISNRKNMQYTGFGGRQ